MEFDPEMWMALKKIIVEAPAKKRYGPPRPSQSMQITPTH
jgi:hypothetical protein